MRRLLEFGDDQGVDGDVDERSDPVERKRASALMQIQKLIRRPDAMTRAANSLGRYLKQFDGATRGISADEINMVKSGVPDVLAAMPKIDEVLNDLHDVVSTHLMRRRKA